MGKIQDVILKGIESGELTKAAIARSRGKSQVHSSTQYPSFLAKIEDIERCMENLGYEIAITKKNV